MGFSPYRARHFKPDWVNWKNSLVLVENRKNDDVTRLGGLIQ